MMRRKNIKTALVIILLYLVFVFLFLEPKYGSQFERLNGGFDDAPPLDLSLNKKKEELIKKSDLPKDQTSAFNKLTSSFSLPDSIKIKKVEEKDFSDSSLGCPKKGSNYSQVITPGYIFTIVGKDNKVSDYRISKDLNIFVNCSLLSKDTDKE